MLKTLNTTSRSFTHCDKAKSHRNLDTMSFNFCLWRKAAGKWILGYP